MAGEGADHDRVFLFFGLRMPHEDRLPGGAKHDGAAPTMREADRAQRRMESTNAFFERIENLTNLRRRNVHIVQIVGVRSLYQTRSKNYGIIFANAAPKIGQVRRVEGFSLRQADLCKLVFSDGLGSNCKRQSRMRALLQVG